MVRAVVGDILQITCGAEQAISAPRYYQERDHSRLALVTLVMVIAPNISNDDGRPPVDGHVLRLDLARLRLERRPAEHAGQAVIHREDVQRILVALSVPSARDEVLAPGKQHHLVDVEGRVEVPCADCARGFALPVAFERVRADEQPLDLDASERRDSVALGGSDRGKRNVAAPQGPLPDSGVQSEFVIQSADLQKSTG